MTNTANVPAGTYTDLIKEVEESLDSYTIPEYRKIAEELLQAMKDKEEARK